MSWMFVTFFVQVVYNPIVEQIGSLDRGVWQLKLLTFRPVVRRVFGGRCVIWLGGPGLHH